MTQLEVAITRAGPYGLTTALILCRANVKVTLFEIRYQNDFKTISYHLSKFATCLTKCSIINGKNVQQENLCTTEMANVRAFIHQKTSAIK